MHSAPWRGALLTVIDGGEHRGTTIAVRAAALVFMTALTAAAAQVSVSIPFTAIPFTLQPMVVLMAGMVLGPRVGAASQLLYLAAGAAGLPVFAVAPNLPQGAARLLGASGGYLLSYPLAAFATGWLAARGFDRRYVTSFIAMLVGLAIIYTLGVSRIAGLALAAGAAPSMAWQTALATGLYPFVLADLLKVALAAGALPALWRLLRPAVPPHP